MNHRLTALFAVLLLLPAPSLSAEQIEAVGVIEAGVEAGCLVLTTEDARYNVSAAVPKPEVGSYGRVIGTASDRLSLCMQGTVLSPATWEPLRKPGDSSRDE